jgi:ribosomal-protein-alanine N-acetyltransferase
MFLQTERTRIRPLVATDLEKLTSLFSSAEAMQFIPPHFAPETVEQTRDRLEHYISQFNRHGISFGYVSDHNGNFLGRAGFYYLNEVGLYEIGCSLMPQYWGQGLATEIAHGLLNYAFKELNLDAVCARTIPGNEGSENVLDKTGFNLLGERMFDIHGQPFLWNYYECYNDDNLEVAEQHSESGYTDDWDLSY